MLQGTPITNTTQQGNSNVAPAGEASQISLDREYIRRVFQTNSVNGKGIMKTRWPQTPFRVVMNAGDLYLRQSEPGGANQVKGSVGIGRYRMTLASVDGVKRGDGASGNQHYVYDISDYTRYKKLRAKLQNYNDTTFGGNTNGAYVPLMSVRRF